MKEVMVKITTNQVNEQGEEDIMEFVTEASFTSEARRCI